MPRNPKRTVEKSPSTNTSQEKKPASRKTRKAGKSQESTAPSAEKAARTFHLKVADAESRYGIDLRVQNDYGHENAFLVTMGAVAVAFVEEAKKFIHPNRCCVTSWRTDIKLRSNKGTSIMLNGKPEPVSMFYPVLNIRNGHIELALAYKEKPKDGQLWIRWVITDIFNNTKDNEN